MSDTVKNLLAQYDAKLKQAADERRSMNAGRSNFNHRAFTILMETVKPVLLKLAAELKDAGHEAWTHESYCDPEETKKEFSKVALACRLKTIGANDDGSPTEIVPPSVEFIADLDKLAIVVVARPGPPGPRGFPTSVTQEVGLEQTTDQLALRISIEWLQRLIESTDPRKPPLGYPFDA